MPWSLFVLFQDISLVCSVQGHTSRDECKANDLKVWEVFRVAASSPPSGIRGENTEYTQPFLHTFVVFFRNFVITRTNSALSLLLLPVCDCSPYWAEFISHRDWSRPSLSAPL